VLAGFNLIFCTKLLNNSITLFYKAYILANYVHVFLLIKLICYITHTRTKSKNKENESHKNRLFKRRISAFHISGSYTSSNMFSLNFFVVSKFTTSTDFTKSKAPFSSFFQSNFLGGISGFVWRCTNVPK